MASRVAQSALVLLLAAAATVAWAGPPDVEIEVEPREATVGDPISVRLGVVLGPGTRFDPPDLGERFGDLEVLDGAWDGPSPVDGGSRWDWRGRVAAYRVGEVEIPELHLQVESAGGVLELTTRPVALEIRSVLPAGEAESEPADLKPPASMPPDYAPVWWGIGTLGGLLALALLLWWAYRRFAPRLAAVPQAEDPFRRMPPHEWVYAELKELLSRGWAERGEVGRFHEELARIVKKYLAARYRVELLEHTTGEIEDLLTVAGASLEVTTRARGLLASCDRVKFAKAVPDVARCRAIVEEAYGIVDATRPQVRREEGAA